MKESYCITLKEDAKPFQVTVPLPLYQKTKEELDKMLETGVISKVDQPTDWCAPMVVTPKRPKGACEEREPSPSSSRHNTGQIGGIENLH